MRRRAGVMKVWWRCSRTHVEVDGTLTPPLFLSSAPSWRKNITHLWRSRCSAEKQSFNTSHLRRCVCVCVCVCARATLTSMYLQSPFSTEAHNSRKNSCSRNVRSITRISVCRAHLSGGSEALRPARLFIHSHQVVERAAAFLLLLLLLLLILLLLILHPISYVLVTTERERERIWCQKMLKPHESWRHHLRWLQSVIVRADRWTADPWWKMSLMSLHFISSHLLNK